MLSIIEHFALQCSAEGRSLLVATLVQACVLTVLSVLDDVGPPGALEAEEQLYKHPH